MKLSARNQLKGCVTAIKRGAIHVEVTLEIAPDVWVTSIITKQACDALQLEVGSSAYAVIKAPQVMLAVEDQG